MHLLPIFYTSDPKKRQKIGSKCVDLIIPPLSEGGGGYTVLPLSVCPSVRPSKIFFSATWWQKSDIWSQVSYRYPISWEAFLDLSDSYFLFAEEQGYHKWALAHSSSCLFCFVSCVHIKMLQYTWEFVITLDIMHQYLWPATVAIWLWTSLSTNQERSINATSCLIIKWTKSSKFYQDVCHFFMH